MISKNKILNKSPSGFFGGVWHYAEFEILDPTGVVCGKLKTSLRRTEEQMGLGFSKIGGFAQYRDQIPLDDIYPVLKIDDIWIKTAYRDQGLATKALKQLFEDARNEGAKIAFLRVGWGSDEELVWNVDWYSRRGFVQLKNALPDLDVPFMWRPLCDDFDQG